MAMGPAHVAVFANPVFDRIPVLRDWLRGLDPDAGAYERSIAARARSATTTNPFEQRFGAGLRIITDLASPADARMIATPGQSGNPLSPHFADLLSPVARLRLAGARPAPRYRP